MNEPVERYSPVGAVLETCEASTHQADVTTLDALCHSASQKLDATRRVDCGLAYQAALRQVVIAPACASVVAGIGSPFLAGFLTMQDAAP